MTICLPKIW